MSKGLVCEDYRSDYKYFEYHPVLCCCGSISNPVLLLSTMYVYRVSHGFVRYTSVCPCSALLHGVEFELTSRT